MTVLQQSARIILLCCVGKIQSPAAKHMYFLNFNGISTSVTRPFLFARKALKIEVRNNGLQMALPCRQDVVGYMPLYHSAGQVRETVMKCL